MILLTNGSCIKFAEVIMGLTENALLIVKGRFFVLTACWRDYVRASVDKFNLALYNDLA